MIKLLFAGDFRPIERISGLIENQKYFEIFAGIQPLLNSADYSIVNLESPVIKIKDRKISKWGPNLGCSSDALKALKIVGFNMICLANNHFYDFGDHGVTETLKACKDLGIDYVGGGLNLDEAKKVFYKKIENKTLAFLNICEQEFSVATDLHGGSNPLSPIENFYHIQEAKKNADFVVVIVHGGHEDYQLPSPRMKKTYRFFVDAGANLIINHHQHCYSGYEVYKGVPIFYGLGNLCYDSELRNDKWNYGYVVQINIADNLSFTIIPYVQCNENAEVRMLTEKEKEQFDCRILELNKIIMDDIELDQAFVKFSSQKYKGLLSLLQPYNNKYTRALFHRRLLPSFLSKNRFLAIYDMMLCESHYDIFKQALKNKYKSF